MNEKKVSIIVPVYNVKEYVSECLNSLLDQSYWNIEIIVVDDGSTDGSGEICDSYSQKDPRIHVIHQVNGGAASARNAALDCMKGDYVAFVDSDDVAKPRMIESLVDELEKNCADIAVCSYSKWFTAHTEEVLCGQTGIKTAEEYLESFLKEWRSGLIWNKLFRAELLRAVRFETGHLIDDEFFTYQAVLQAKRIAMTDKVLYDYRQRRSSVMNQGKQKQMLLDRIAYFPERFRLVTQRYPGLYMKYLSNIADSIIIFRRSAEKYCDIKREVVRMQWKYLPRVLLSRLDIKEKYAYVRAIVEKATVSSSLDKETDQTELFP